MFADVSFSILSNPPQTGVIYSMVPTYSPATLSVGFTGLALCSYTECCGLGGWVGLLVALRLQTCLWRCAWFLGLLEKTKFRFEKFQLAAFRYLEFSDVAKSSLESHIVSVKLLDV